MSNSVKNTRGLRSDLQQHLSLGLNASNSWVLNSLDCDELEHLKRVHFPALNWTDEEHVLIVRGTSKCGLSVRFVQLTQDRRYCRFHRQHPMTYLSPRLLRADPIPLREFVASIAQNPTLRIFKDKLFCKLTGILVGLRDAKFRSLILLKGNVLDSVLIADDAPESASILEDNPTDGEEVRARILELYS